MLTLGLLLSFVTFTNCFLVRCTEFPGSLLTPRTKYDPEIKGILHVGTGDENYLLPKFSIFALENPKFA